MLRDPCWSKNVLLTTFGPKTPFAKPEEKNLEPFDLLATVGQSCVRVNVSVLASVCVCVCVCVKNDVVVL